MRGKWNQYLGAQQRADCSRRRQWATGKRVIRNISDGDRAVSSQTLHLPFLLSWAMGHVGQVLGACLPSAGMTGTHHHAQCTFPFLKSYLFPTCFFLFLFCFNFTLSTIMKSMVHKCRNLLSWFHLVLNLQHLEGTLFHKYLWDILGSVVPTRHKREPLERRVPELRKYLRKVRV